MKKGMIIASSVATALLLSACGSKPVKHAATPAAKVTSSAQRTTHHTKKGGYVSGWNDGKASKLRDYMVNFGHAMKQQYSEVTANSDFSFMDTNLGKYIKDKQPITIDGNTQSVEWLPGAHGGTKNKENILAIYADSADSILYLFTEKNDVTRVLVTQSAPGNGAFSFKTTANADIQHAFANIAADKAVQKPESATTTSSSANNHATNDKNNLDPKADGSTPAEQFPNWLQGTWYSYDQNTDDTHEINFKDNKLQYPNNPPLYAYDARHRDANDMKWQNGDMTATIPYRENNWIEVNLYQVAGHPAANIRGWYQSAGAGETYYLVNQNIHGQTVPVITDGSGAGAWGSTHYFKSKVLAQQNHDVHFSSDQTAN